MSSKESWQLAWQTTCNGKASGWATGAQRIAWSDDDLLEALRADIVDWLRMPGDHKAEVEKPGDIEAPPHRAE